MSRQDKQSERLFREKEPVDRSKIVGATHVLVGLVIFGLSHFQVDWAAELGFIYLITNGLGFYLGTLRVFQWRRPTDE